MRYKEGQVKDTQKMEMGYSQPQILLNWYLVMEHFCPQTWLLGLLIFLIVYQISLFFAIAEIDL